MENFIDKYDEMLEEQKRIKQYEDKQLQDMTEEERLNFLKAKVNRSNKIIRENKPKNVIRINK